MRESNPDTRVVDMAARREAKAPKRKAVPLAPDSYAERILLEAGPKTEADTHEWKYESAVAASLIQSLRRARAELVAFKPSSDVRHNLEQLSTAWGLPVPTVVGLLLSRLLTEGIQVSLIEESSGLESSHE